MTREEAIEAIKMAQAQVEWDYPMDYAAAFDMAIEALKPAGWISAKDRVPDMDVLKSDWVIGCVYGRVRSIRYEGAICMVGYDDGHWWIDSAPEVDVTVTHWMPLPAPPASE
jgi:Protein of unknown function (DUF551).